MQQVKPYANIQEAVQALDNGGRFYNIFTKADDGLITKSELAKVAGLFSNKQKMMLFLELSLSEMNEADKNSIIEKLDEKLQKAYTEFKPEVYSINELLGKGKASDNAIVQGIPKLAERKSDFNGFIMSPVVGPNHVTSFTLIPIIDQYEVYELKDERSKDQLMIAHTRGAARLPEKRISLAGSLKEIKSDLNEDSTTSLIMEAIYFLDSE